MDSEAQKKEFEGAMCFDRSVEDTAAVVDASGHSFNLNLVDGRLYGSFGEKFIRDAFTMEVRPDDVFLCGYPKTGAHWAMHYLFAIIRDEFSYDESRKISNMMEFTPSNVKAALPSPRVLNTHIRFDRMPQKMKEFKNKIIVTRRNPKDTTVSLYRHTMKVGGYKGDFKDFLELFIEGRVENGNFFDYYNSWEDVIQRNPDLPILLVDFEDLKEDMLSGLRRICHFLGVQLSDTKLQDVANFTEFGAMKKAYGDRFFVRKGQVGGWKEWLTVAQSERIDTEFKNRMSSSSYSPRYSL